MLFDSPFSELVDNIQHGGYKNCFSPEIKQALVEIQLGKEVFDGDYEISVLGDEIIINSNYSA